MSRGRPATRCTRVCQLWFTWRVERLVLWDIDYTLVNAGDEKAVLVEIELK